MAKSSTVPARRPTSSPAAKAPTGDVLDTVQNTSGVPQHLGDDTDIDDEKVTAIVPRGFTLTRDGFVPVVFEAGVGEYYQRDVDHWYAQAMGVKVYTKE